jgi:hypothetical protein
MGDLLIHFWVEEGQLYADDTRGWHVAVLQRVDEVTMNEFIFVEDEIIEYLDIDLRRHDMQAWPNLYPDMKLLYLG